MLNILNLRLVDGGWTVWTSWDSCTVTCAGGTKTRSRSCSNPTPQYGGRSCSGSSTSSQACYTQSCPSKTSACNNDSILSKHIKSNIEFIVVKTYKHILVTVWSIKSSTHVNTVFCLTNKWINECRFFFMTNTDIFT